MRIRLLIAAVLLIGSLQIHGQHQDTLKKAFYGIELNQFITGSGYKSGTEILISVTEGRRNLQIGFYYCTEARRITGVIAHHEISLLRNYSRKGIQPYFFYNGIARITRLESISVDNSGQITSGTYKTFEHHFGIGLRAIITKNIYFSSAAGYGVYFGSVKRPVTMEGTNEIKGSNGFSPIIKAGVGIVL